MGVNPEVLDLCEGLNFTTDYVVLWDWQTVDNLITLYKECLSNLVLITDYYDKDYEINYELKISISDDEICFEQCSVGGFWKEVWRENIKDFDGESVSNIDYKLLAMQNGRL